MENQGVVVVKVVQLEERAVGVDGPVFVEPEGDALRSVDGLIDERFNSEASNVIEERVAGEEGDACSDQSGEGYMDSADGEHWECHFLAGLIFCKYYPICK